MTLQTRQAKGGHLWVVDLQCSTLSDHEGFGVTCRGHTQDRYGNFTFQRVVSVVKPCTRAERPPATTDTFQRSVRAEWDEWSLSSRNHGVYTQTCFGVLTLRDDAPISDQLIPCGSMEALGHVRVKERPGMSMCVAH